MPNNLFTLSFGASRCASSWLSLTMYPLYAAGLEQAEMLDAIPGCGVLLSRLVIKHLASN
jgi:hypothetical protein